MTCPGCRPFLHAGKGTEGGHFYMAAHVVEALANTDVCGSLDHMW
jgi:hypothetical protein